MVVLCVGEAVIGTSVFIDIVEFFHLIQFGMLADLCLDGGGRGTDKQKYGDQPYRLCFECRSHVYICLRGLETDIEL